MSVQFSNLRKNIEHLISKSTKILKAKKILAIFTSTAANESGILAKLTSLMTSDLNFTRKRKFTKTEKQQ